MAKYKILIILITILTIAAFFRLWKLSSIPPGLYPDVAINGNEALEALKTRNFQVFYRENNGREGLFINLIALSFAIFGISIWSIKIVAAVFGIFTVLGIYLFTKELFKSLESKFYNSNSEAIALLSAFFLAISFWHTNLSRIGFRVISLPFFLIFSFYFLLKGFRTKKILFSILGGLFFGLGLYTYTSFRFAVLLLPIIFTPFYQNSKKIGYQKEFFKKTAYFLLTVFLVTLPIGLYFLKNPADFVGRAAPISIFAAPNPLKEFVKSLVLHLGMFNFYGDGNWRHNFSGSPMLFWPIGILFLIGLISSTVMTFKTLKDKNWSLGFSHWLLLNWFFIMLLPGILTKEGLPHALRTAGVIPAVFIFAGLGAYEFFQFLNTTKHKKLLFLACVMFLIAVTSYEFNKYFIVWAQKKEVRDAFSSNYLEIGNYLNSLNPEIKKYLIVNQDGVVVPWPNGIPMPAQTVMFIENIKYGSPQSIYLKSSELNQIQTDNRKTEIVLMKYDSDILINLKTKFPKGNIRQEKEIWHFEINF